MKLQSAVEYLTTYGWALLIIAIVAVSLFEIVTSAPSIQECIMPAGFSCPVFYLSQNGVLFVNLVQATQYPIQVTALGCVNPESTADMYSVNAIGAVLPPNTFVNMPVGANVTFNIPCYSSGVQFSGAIKSSFSGYIVVNYTNAYTNFPSTIYGSVRATVTR